MRILLFSLEFPPISGGISVFLYNICLQLSRLGHKADVLTPFREGGLQMHGGKGYSFYQYKELKLLSSFIPLFRILSLNIKNKYDLVFIGHFTTTHALGVLILHLIWRVPYVLLIHGNDLYYSISNFIDSPVARLVLSNASMVLCNSRVTANRVVDSGYQGCINILHPGTDPKRFNPDMNTSEVTKRYSLAGKKVLLSVSRLVERKGYEQVLRALPEVIKRVPDVLYLIAGEGEQEDRLRKIAKELGLDSKVIFIGYAKENDLPTLFCACDIFIMPSLTLNNGHDYEGFGIAFIEANACGKPVIGGMSGGMTEAIIDGETGLLVDPNDVNAVAEAIVRLLTDNKLADRLGENGRKRVEKELSWERVGERLEKFLLRLIKSKK